MIYECVDAQPIGIAYLVHVCMTAYFKGQGAVTQLANTTALSVIGLNNKRKLLEVGGDL